MPSDPVVRFGPFVLDGKLRELRRDGSPIDLQPMPMALLWYLVRHRDRVVSSDELKAEVWKGISVGDAAVAAKIRDLRRALCDGSHTLIKTARGYGYRFTADIEPVSSPGSAPARSAPTEALIGREAELAELRQAVASCMRGRGGVRIVSGPTGIGKSRLVDELTAEAATRGFGVHLGTAPAIEGAPPLWIWAQLARSCAQSLEGCTLAPLAHAALASLASLLEPETDPAADPAVSMSGPTRFRLALALTELLAEAARVGPRLLVLEDLHWADAGSLALLELIAGAVRNERVLIVATLRHGCRREVRSAIADVLRCSGAERVELSGLCDAGVRRLFQLHFPRDASEDLLLRVCAATAGSPLHVTELARLCAERSSVSALEPLPIPSSIRDALELELATLRPEAQQLLCIAAVCGASFSIEVVRRVLDPAAATDTALVEVEEAGLVRELRDRPGDYELTRPHWREMLYDRFTRVDVRRVHLRIGEALEAVYADDLRPHLAALADHFARASPVGGAAGPDRAEHYARQAALGCERVCA